MVRWQAYQSDSILTSNWRCIYLRDGLKSPMAEWLKPTVTYSHWGLSMWSDFGLDGFLTLCPSSSHAISQQILVIKIDKCCHPSVIFDRRFRLARINWLEYAEQFRFWNLILWLSAADLIHSVQNRNNWSAYETQTVNWFFFMTSIPHTDIDQHTFFCSA